MSVINNILKDLENKQTQFTPIGVATANSVGISIARFNWFWPVMVLGLSLLVFAIWNSLEFLNIKSVQTNHLSIETLVPAPLPKVVEAPVASNIEVPANPGESTVNKIIGLQLKETDSIFNLKFVLQSRVVAYLKERNETSFIFHMKDVDSEIIAPTIRNNQWIDSLRIIPADAGVDIEFHTVDRVLVGTEQYQELEESIWSIKLEKVKKVAVPTQGVTTELQKGDIGQTVAYVETSDASVIEESDGIASVNPVVSKSFEPVTPVENPPVKLEISSARQSSSSLKLQRATELVRKKRWNQAELILLDLLELDEDIEARDLLLRIYESSQQTNKLHMVLKESLQRYPAHPNFNMVQGRVFFSQGQYKRTIELLTPVASRQADQLALIGASFHRLDNYQSAIEFYRASLKIESRQARNWISLGLSLEHNGQLEEALDSYRAAVKLGNLSQRLMEFVDKRKRTLEKVIK